MIMAGAKNDTNENPHDEDSHDKNPHDKNPHDKDSHDRLYIRAVIVLTALRILLCIAIMTNAIHGQMFHIRDAAYEKYSYGMIYIVVAIWETVFSIAAFSVMMRKCRIYWREVDLVR